MGIKENLLKYRELTALKGVELVAVSKTKPVEALHTAYDMGQRHFGENKVQELVAKAEELPKDIKWHMIGHLQRNKVKYIAPFVHLIHGVDSPRLAKEIDKQAKKAERVLDVLLQIHISDEATKFGFDSNEVLSFLEQEGGQLTNVRFCGLMGIATNTDNQEQVRQEFSFLKAMFEQVKAEFERPNYNFQILSMGMSNDLQMAIDEGSTMVRIGSSIFGART